MGSASEQENSILSEEDGPLLTGQERTETSKERWEEWCGVVYLELLRSAFDNERRVRKSLEKDADSLEESLERDKDDIWARAGLFNIFSPESEKHEKTILSVGEKESPKYRDLVKKRQKDLRSRIDGEIAADIVLFNTFIGNGDYSIAGN